MNFIIHLKNPTTYFLKPCQQIPILTNEKISSLPHKLYHDHKSNFKERCCMIFNYMYTAQLVNIISEIRVNQFTYITKITKYTKQSCTLIII